MAFNVFGGLAALLRRQVRDEVEANRKDLPRRVGKNPLLAAPYEVGGRPIDADLEDAAERLAIQNGFKPIPTHAVGDPVARYVVWHPRRRVAFAGPMALNAITEARHTIHGLQVTWGEMVEEGWQISRVEVVK